MDDLTSIVTSTLEARGVLNKIRAELRANVFSAIQEQQGGADEAPNAALEGLRRTSHGQLAAELLHEMLLSCSLDYSLAVLLPEAGLTDLKSPDRKALAASLGLDATGEEPLLAQLVRERMQGSRAKPLSARADSDAAAAAPPAQPTGGGSSLGARDLPPLGRPSAGGPLGDLPPLGGRPRGADDEQEEERRLDAIESKLGLLAGMPLTTARPATAPAQSATAPAATGADDFEDELIEEDISDEFEEDESDELSMSASQSAPLVAGGLGSLSASLQTSRVFDRSMDESMSPTRLNRELQGFDHTEEVEPLRAAAALPPLQPRSSGPSLAPLQTPRGASSQPQLSGSQTL